FTGIKGGHNDESHNHNDIGVFFLYYDGLPVVIDAGAGMYTIKTFGPDRYDIWTMQSQWHSLPEINGMGQAPGRKYRSIGFSHVVSDDESMCSMEITEAYPISIGLREFIRGYALNRDKEEVMLHDSISLARPSSDIKWYLNLAYEPVIIDDGRIILNNGRTGILMEYDCGQFTVTIEKKHIADDKKLSDSWGDAIYRLCLETKTKAEFHKINVRFIVLEEDCSE
ncbi:MAG: heparinase II/III family protein, partial [Clostridia bacterium]|nr:heparinase II/III family protein [Clostridia bacterium]